MKEKIIKIVKQIFSSKRRAIMIGLVVVASVVGILIYRGNSGDSEVVVQTTAVEKGTIVQTISTSGTITSGNSTDISTKVSGVVSQVYVQNGDTVVKGQKIAQVTLDEYATERQAEAWVAYLDAQEAVKEAEQAKVTADITMWQARENVLNAQDAVDDGEGDTDGEKMIVDKTLDETRLAFEVAEMKYLNADSEIVKARANVTSALRDYQENSSMIIAPSSGKISDLALATGLVLNADSSTSSTNGSTIVSSQTVGKISNEGQILASVNLTEIDAVNVKSGQKVTLTVDAYEDLTFTGEVLAVNTSGSVSSGVTSYPATILISASDVELYPNMGVSAEIILDIKKDILVVPSTAINTSGDQSYVVVDRDGEQENVVVETGISNDSLTEIMSGLSEGDEVVTSTLSSASNDSETSAFSSNTGFGGMRDMSGGGGMPPGGGQ